MNGAVQTRFLKHESCGNCGSRDNRAVYEGGSSYCFGCGKYERGESSGKHRVLQQLGERRSVGSESEHDIRPPPDDAGTLFGRKCLEWVGKYDLSAVDLIRHNVKWSPSREQLVYIFYGAGKDVVLWQARNFKDGTTHKTRFFTGGTPASVVAAYYPSEKSDTAIIVEGEASSRCQTCVIVEDCISGIKCANSGYVGIPCFSAAMPKQKLAQIARMFSRCLVWLDEDKLKEARNLATQCAMLGMYSRVIHTPLDPKEYNVEVIQEKVGT